MIWMQLSQAHDRTHPVVIPLLHRRMTEAAEPLCSSATAGILLVYGILGDEFADDALCRP